MDFAAALIKVTVLVENEPQPGNAAVENTQRNFRDMSVVST